MHSVKSWRILQANVSSSAKLTTIYHWTVCHSPKWNPKKEKKKFMQIFLFAGNGLNFYFECVGCTCLPKRRYDSKCLSWNAMDVFEKPERHTLTQHIKGTPYLNTLSSKSTSLLWNYDLGRTWGLLWIALRTSTIQNALQTSMLKGYYGRKAFVLR
jgi:hypothetical protein